MGIGQVRHCIAHSANIGGAYYQSQGMGTKFILGLSDHLLGSKPMRMVLAWVETNAVLLAES